MHKFKQQNFYTFIRQFIENLESIWLTFAHIGSIYIVFNAHDLQ